MFNIIPSTNIVPPIFKPLSKLSNTEVKHNDIRIDIIMSSGKYAEVPTRLKDLVQTVIINIIPRIVKQNFLNLLRAYIISPLLYYLGLKYQISCDSDIENQPNCYSCVITDDEHDDKIEYFAYDKKVDVRSMLFHSDFSSPVKTAD